MVCVSAATDYLADAYILDADNNRITCQESFKALGVYFSNRLDFELHVTTLVRRLRSRLWTLRNLKTSGFTEEELVTVYKTMLRPVAEYGCVAFHSSLTDDQDARIERVQDHALKCIFGPGMSARKMRGQAGLETLRERRIYLCDKFAKKCSDSPFFHHWFPRKETRASSRIRGEQFLEEKARCQRLMNSPLFYFRRRLNGKEGKIYGQKNKSYREDIVV